MAIVYRNEKGSELTFSEVDNNFAELKVLADSKKTDFEVLPIAQGGTGQTTAEGIRAALGLPDDASEIAYFPSGTGAVATDVQSKLRESVSVKDFGAVGDGVTDDYPEFLAAITALPDGGGQIAVPPGIYKLDIEPTWGAKSIYWDISPGATFSGGGTGVGKFPYMETNPAQMAVGPYIQSRSYEHSVHANGGIAALQVEMIQPSDYGPGQSVALYLGASGSCANASANVWALNALIRADAGALGTYQCLEIDVDCFSSSANVKGISISGAGSANPDVALEIVRLGGTWNRGIHIINATDAILINVNTGVGGTRGIVSTGAYGILNSFIDAGQIINGSNAIVVKRFTDTAPTGKFLDFITTTNSSLFSVDVAGACQAIQLNVGGTAANAVAGIKVAKDSGTWSFGVRILNSGDGINITPVTGGRGIVIGSPIGTQNTAIDAQQAVDGATMLALNRFTDTAPTGNFLKFMTTAGVNLFNVDVSGNFSASGIGIVNHVRVTAGAVAASAGQFAIGGTNQSTVGASGAASALPAQPRGYLICYDGATKVLIPYYNA